MSDPAHSPGLIHMAPQKIVESIELIRLLSSRASYTQKLGRLHACSSPTATQPLKPSRDIFHSPKVERAAYAAHEDQHIVFRKERPEVIRQDGRQLKHDVKYGRHGVR